MSKSVSLNKRWKEVIFAAAGLGPNLLMVLMMAYFTDAVIPTGLLADKSFWSYGGVTIVYALIFPILWTIGRFFDGIVDVPMAALTDKLKNKKGGRFITILISFVPMVVSFILCWIPVFGKGADITVGQQVGNTIWIFFWSIIFFATYTLALITFYGSLSEVCKNQTQRARVSAYKSVFDTISYALVYAAIPAIFKMLNIPIWQVALYMSPMMLTILIPFAFMKKQENEEEEENEEKELEYNEVDEDNYMQELYTQLAKMRQERKDAQNNAKLLDNRVNLLRNEERKELKKIESAKQKANNKLIRLQQMVETNKIREESKKLKEKEIEIKKNHNKKMNEEIKNKTEKSKAMHKKQIEGGAKLVKMQKQYNKQLYDFLKKENFNENKTKYNCLKNQKSYNEEQKKLISREKRMFLKQELEKKLLEEYRLKEEAEAKKCKAEQEEIEIIKKLQTTTQLHKNIMNEIEKMNINTVIKGGTHPKNSNNTSKSGSSKHNK